VDSFFTRSSIFAFTSSSEGFPNVIGEALSAELPVIAFDCIAGPSEMIINEENGFLLTLGDHIGFESRLKELMENDVTRERLSRNARKSVARFEKSNISKEYFEFLTRTN
jgi:GalNAc-alpha-(1->4)-GalNAc-alpha-(1->3)-diNAcBac-PP-undecaprenol alpha-1,4-N-acetyl-D-galactosaminyltransferase